MTGSVSSQAWGQGKLLMSLQQGPDEKGAEDKQSLNIREELQ